MRKIEQKAFYLTPSMLCQQAGLTTADLQRLEEVGLLQPTRVDPPRYRPKLLSWAKKLAYLIEQGWTLAEIQQWSKERWTWPNPRLWPPPKPETTNDPKKAEPPQGRAVSP